MMNKDKIKLELLEKLDNLDWYEGEDAYGVGVLVALEDVRKLLEG